VEELPRITPQMVTEAEVSSFSLGRSDDVQRWLSKFKYDPIAPLLASGDAAVIWHVRRDLLNEKKEAGPVRALWDLPEVTKIIRKQQEDGSFPYPGKRHDVYPHYHYALLETWKQFRFLVDQYAFTKRHPACRRAAEFLFSCQTEAGDIRGMLANQYATYYSGAIMGLLIKAGYGRDPRVEKGLRWLLDMRQNDGGWTVPILTANLTKDEGYRLTSEHAEPIEPDRTYPFSHNWTGMVIRAFAAHSKYRRLKAVRDAANLLKSRFFEKDSYTSYQSADYWTRFQYPFWWNHLVAALDSLSLIGIPRDDPDIQRGLTWLFDHQKPTGLWKHSYELKKKKKPGKGGKPAGVEQTELWITLAICRIVKRYYDSRD
jgi:hypothetical protein